jgi:hypothetical protein
LITFDYDKQGASWGYHKGLTIMKPNWENHMARSCGYDGDTCWDISKNVVLTVYLNGKIVDVQLSSGCV